MVVINGIEYGRGVGSSKKEAKSEAARLSLEILIPEFKNKLMAKNGVITKDLDLSVSFMYTLIIGLIIVVFYLDKKISTFIDVCRC